MIPKAPSTRVSAVSLAIANLLLGLLVILSTIVVVLHLIGWINAWQFPLKPIAAFLLGASLACRGLAQWRGHQPRHQREVPQNSHRPAPSQPRWTGLKGLAVALCLSIIVIPFTISYAITHTCHAGTFCLGVPRPQNTRTPGDRNLAYTTLEIPVGHSPTHHSSFLEAWTISTPQPTPQGTVILFPGHLGTKGSQLIPPAQSFAEQGYDTLLVDFQGVGNSSGNTVTVGMREAQDVAAAFHYAQTQSMQEPLLLYGVSMGSATILRAIALEGIQPDGVVLELPFLRFLDAIAVRLRYAKLPAFPLAHLLTFWGGLQHGFNGFGHNPIDFASSVNCPVLVLHGEQDRWVTVQEIERLFAQFQEPKQLVISPEAGHHQLIGVNRSSWDQSLATFLAQISK